ncbi:MAG: DUF3015 family protein [Bacteriovoracaceae bacterium]
MKLFILFALLSLNALAWERPYGMAGCGFGSQVMGKDGNQILGVTTNATGTQTFGISSGTSNCVTAKEQTARIKNFIEANYESLITDMAKGQGESVATLSSFYGCNSDVFASEMKNHYSTLVAEKENATHVMVNINKVIDESSDLRATCSNAI